MNPARTLGSAPPAHSERNAHYPFVEEPAVFQAVVRGWLARPG